ncbi:hypothetical protein K4039_16175 [Lyngbya sp. CCAP 1446/10]|uniref:DUF3226 domain-containing protein n=1 Tax=Lyngbya sp. CCAP 1446/10 TaxID=439293 RepID=UPI0022382A26|nr:DUF3226 domain-containing protein [Lyngbya sp. CCAP 1446/10]MCW6051582.1 hypothetical protein [Lyngbya sp. CCAP 1446/10]
MRYAIIGVEGPHDQAFVGKVLKLLGFKDFREELKGVESDLDPFWRKFIPVYPKKGNLYKRLDMPSILFTESLSIAIYAGEGSNLVTNLDDILLANSEYQTNLAAFGIVADCDKSTPDRIVAPYSNKFRSYFPNFPDNPGVVDSNSPRTGIYVLPDNQQPGVLDTLLCECGQIAYPAYMEKASSYLNEFSELEIKALKWKNFDRQKALVATVVSVLKPGKTNTTSIADNNWVSQQTQQEVPALANFIKFLIELLELN